MENNSCIGIPSKIGNEEEVSPVFRGMMDVTTDRNEQSLVWALERAILDDDESREKLGFKKGEEPSFAEFVERVNDCKGLVDENTYARIVSKRRGLDTKTYSDYNSMREEYDELDYVYQDLLPIVSVENNKYKIKVVPRNTDNVNEYASQAALMRLNSKLTNDLEMMGFAVEDIDDFGMPGMFSPKDAEKNAKDLIQLIKVSRTEEGLKALPEEYAHLAIEGLHDNKLVQRMLAILEDDNIVREVLGDKYDEYNELYDGDKELMAKEAAGRILAQGLANLSGIDGGVLYISKRLMSSLNDYFKNGSTDNIEEALLELANDAKEIADELLNDDNMIDTMDGVKILNAKTMYRIVKKASSLKDIAENREKLLAKRIKLMSLKTGEVTPAQVRRINAVRRENERARYDVACTNFLKLASDDILSIAKDLQKCKNGSFKAKTNDDRIWIIRTLNNAESAIKAYKKSVHELTTLPSKEGINDASNDTKLEIAELASDVELQISNLQEDVNNLKCNTLIGYYQQYWGNDKQYTLGKAPTTVTLEDVMESWYGDSSGFARQVNAMADMADPFLQLVDIAYKDATNNRDIKVMQLNRRLAFAQKRYTDKTGKRDTSFVYERFDNGKPSGMYKSEYDHAKYYRARAEHRESLRKQYEYILVDENGNHVTYEDRDKATQDSRRDFFEQIRFDMADWEKHNTEIYEYTVGKRTFKQSVPKKELYGSNALNEMNDAERELYDEVIQVKKEMDALLPRRYAHDVFRAPQKKVDIKDQALHGDSPKNIAKRIKDKFVSSIDDTEYGEEIDEIDETSVNGVRHIVTDIDGKPVKKVPVYYTRWLGDEMNLLDTNAMDSLMSYGSMAYNYQEMSKMAEVLELSNSQMHDRKLLHLSASQRLRERFRLLDKVYEEDYITGGESSQSAKKLRNYIDTNVYGMRKERETVTLGNKVEFNYGKTMDVLKSYSTLVGMGYNFFSGMTNASMGLVQIFLQHGKRNGYYSASNLFRANIEYGKHIPGVIADKYSDIKRDKLTLAMQKFDALEDYYRDVNDSMFNSGVPKKMIGEHSAMVFNELGEHMLHAIPLIATLDGIRMRIPDGNGGYVDGSMWDALEVVKKTDTTESGKTYEYYDLAPKKGTVFSNTEGDNLASKIGKMFKDGAEFNNNNWLKVKLVIQEANHRAHGAYADVDRGDINRYAIGRWILNFRQWMPAFYTERFKKHRLNVLTDSEEEGFYGTTASFLVRLPKNIKSKEIFTAQFWSSLQDYERANLTKAVREISLFLAIDTYLHYAGDDGDKDSGLRNALIYNLYRLRAELGSSVPSLGFYENAKTIMRTPIPAMESFDVLANLLDVGAMTRIIESGRFEGWTQYEKNLYYALPYVKNIDKAARTLFEGDNSIMKPYITGFNGNMR